MTKKAPAASNVSKKKSKPFPIVAIGASAGGLEAVTELLRHLPSTTGMAYIYIQHLDPHFESKLSEILQRETQMRVQEATDMVTVEPDHVYILPPNKELDMVDSTLTLNPRKDKAMHMPVDHFFSSLAEKHQDAAIGIVLSGSANDGTLGLKAIKTAGGITFAQDETAHFQGMPKSAIAEGVVDMILPPRGIAMELDRLSKKAEMIAQVMHGSVETMINDDDEDLAAILQLLKKGTGVDFVHYKMKTIKRRIVRRMLLYKLESLKEYVQYLKQHPTEINVLYQDLLINVTSFFRDPETLEYLKKTMIPKILKNKSAHDPVRIWVPACSTGEEAYSLAMIFMEVLTDRAANIPIQIFATDLSELTIAKARLGLYTKNEVANVSPRRLQRFFTKIDGSYRIVKSIRDLFVFAPHNAFKDPPFSKIDLISCCNLMIYLDTILQKKILATFHYALNPEGMLVLGKSETIGTSTQLFFQPDKKFKVYTRKKEAAARALFEMNYRHPDMERQEGQFGVRKIPPKVNDHGVDLEKMVDNILLDKYVPASVVVNHDLEILQFRGSTGLYLEPSPGKASLNLLKMARPGLAFELRNTIHKATKAGHAVKKAGLEIKINNVSHLISIEVVPLKSESEDRLYLVIFEQIILPEMTEMKSSFSRDKLIRQLEEELKAVKEDMRSIIEEQEASNEELQSANEEIVSSNEELQSINEELETSKEELESTNEELMTINAELQVRNEQLAEAYEYAEAVFETIREAIVVLDKDLRVKSANKSFYKIFGLKEEDVEGMMIFELGSRQWDIPDLRKLLKDTLPESAAYQGLEITHTFPGVGKKIMLINACRVIQKSHQRQLILLAIEDITDLRKNGV
jgi:two-component system, chemotaxis family, CheB/CheR fusion protein